MNNTTILDIERSHEKAVLRARRTESDLADALRKLADARAKKEPEAITPLRVKAQAAERKCSAALAEAEAIRRTYWRERARLAEEELARVALPLLARIEHAHKAGGAMVGVVGWSALTGLHSMRRPAIEDATPVPAVEHSSPVLDRAEDEI